MTYHPSRQLKMVISKVTFDSKLALREYAAVNLTSILRADVKSVRSI